MLSKQELSFLFVHITPSFGAVIRDFEHSWITDVALEVSNQVRHDHISPTGIFSLHSVKDGGAVVHEYVNGCVDLSTMLAIKRQRALMLFSSFPSVMVNSSLADSRIKETQQDHSHFNISESHGKRNWEWRGMYTWNTRYPEHIRLVFCASVVEDDILQWRFLQYNSMYSRCAHWTKQVSNLIVKLQDLNSLWFTVLVPVNAFGVEPLLNTVVGEIGEHIQAAWLVFIGVFVANSDHFPLVLTGVSWIALASALTWLTIHRHQHEQRQTKNQLHLPVFSFEQLEQTGLNPDVLRTSTTLICQLTVVVDWPQC